jgi:hypothetical protein
VGIRCADHVTPSTRKSRHYFADSGGRSVGIVRLWTKATECAKICEISLASSLYPFLNAVIISAYLSPLLGPGIYPTYQRQQYPVRKGEDDRRCTDKSRVAADIVARNCVKLYSSTTGLYKVLYWGDLSWILTWRSNCHTPRHTPSLSETEVIIDSRDNKSPVRRVHSVSK